MAEPGFVAAVEAVVTSTRLREILLQTHVGRQLAKEVVLPDESPDRTSPLEKAAKELRQRIVAEFLASGDPETETEIPATSTPECPRICAPAKQTSLAYVETALQDPAENPLPTRIAEVQVECSSWSVAQLGCPHCRRPLEIDMSLENPAGMHLAGGLCQAGSSSAYCTFLGDGSTLGFLQALALGQSLKATGSSKDRVLILGETVPRPYKEVLAHVWTLHPLQTWPKLPGVVLAMQKAQRLLCLGLTEYAKVLWLDLGLIVCRNVDETFELECPAAAFNESVHRNSGHNEFGSNRPDGSAVGPSANQRRVETSLMLFMPSAQAFSRMLAEIGGPESVVWPPRGSEGNAQFVMVEEYIQRFYTVFFSGKWTEIPQEFIPQRVTEDGDGTLDGAHHCLQIGRSAWEMLDRRLRDPRLRGAYSEVSLLMRHLQSVEEGRRHGSATPVKALEHILSSVEKRRCDTCAAYDGRGTQDPIDNRWRCRYCWEAMLLDAFLVDRCAMPLPQADADELKEDLQECYAGPGRQRYSWASEGAPVSWIEFRPRGVLWTQDGVGAWAWEKAEEQSDVRRLRIHLRRRERSGAKSEVRHTFLLCKGPSEGGHVELEEVNRELLKPLGFCQQPREKKIKCWSMAAAPQLGTTRDNHTTPAENVGSPEVAETNKSQVDDSNAVAQDSQSMVAA